MPDKRKMWEHFSVDLIRFANQRRLPNRENKVLRNMRKQVT